MVDAGRPVGAVDEAVVDPDESAAVSGGRAPTVPPLELSASGTNKPASTTSAVPRAKISRHAAGTDRGFFEYCSYSSCAYPAF